MVEARVPERVMKSGGTHLDPEWQDFQRAWEMGVCQRAGGQRAATRTQQGMSSLSAPAPQPASLLTSTCSPARVSHACCFFTRLRAWKILSPQGVIPSPPILWVPAPGPSPRHLL